MFKRFLLTLTCVAAFSAAGLTLTEKAEGNYWGRRGFYYGPAPRAYYYGPGYGTYYRGYYGPRYYNGPRYYGGPRYYYGRPGVSVSFGW
jgi:hypothetical protein